ncbi:hypothetical protein GCM10010260_36480 [Streptomyces filipinensis]|uniref:Uncharacterized protein n=1 Tax=Streptomyces filipinensis TaxID=66887 RepID=A0A918ICD1_9ACTN|nr:hypothetical protein GCM10010260_36480 [Streptomyces filipinensis]
MTVLGMQAGASFRVSLVSDGIPDPFIEAVTAVFGTVDVTSRGRVAGAGRSDCRHFPGRANAAMRRRGCRAAGAVADRAMAEWPIGRRGRSGPASAGSRWESPWACPACRTLGMPGLVRA